LLVPATAPVTAPVSQSATPASQHAVTYGFAGVTIGASLADLHSIRPRASCGPDKSGVIDCVVPDQPVGGGYVARDLTYRFIGGRLAQIRFHSSIDSFAVLVARLKHDFGPPADLRRGNVVLYGHTFPHVAFIWRNGRSTIQMNDPATPAQMAVKITFDADNARLDAAPA
jgi:hypothetical protein